MDCAIHPMAFKKFDAHVNVEVCSSVKTVKYLFKYAYKGHDCANLELRVASDGQQQSGQGIHIFRCLICDCTTSHVAASF